jgi:hypothetical protein
MATAKTWLWIIGGFAVLCVLGLVLVAGAGLYFVSRHIDMQTTSSSGALREFDAARAQFQTTPPILEIDALERPHEARPVAQLPTSETKPANLYVLAWNPSEDRLVRIVLPFWILRLGSQKIDFLKDGHDVDFEQLDLDFAELERIGPALVLDHNSRSGERVLIWTQ